MPRTTPTSTRPAVLLSAPVPVSPPDGATFSGTTVYLYLEWQGVKSSLATDEYYLVTLDFKHAGQTWSDYAWTKQTEWRVREHAYLLDLSDDGRFTWVVRLVRTAAVPKDGKPSGAEVALSGVSQPRVFVWTKGGTGPAPAPTPEF